MRNSLSLNIAFSLLIGVFTIFMLSVTGYILHISINLSYILIAIVFAIFIPITKYKMDTSQGLISFGFILLLCVISALSATHMADTSNDGLWYHETAIILLKKGWNPVYETADSFFSQYWQVKTTALVWIESYPKLYEIFAANVYYLTNNIETGKMLNLLSLFILFFYCFYVFEQKLLHNKKIINLCFSLLLSLNPIMLSQIYTYYSDGLIYVFFMLMLLAIVNIEQSSKDDKTADAILIMSAVILSNLKLGGIFYTITILIAYSVFLIHKKAKKSQKNLAKDAAVVFFLIFLSGINPYITNLYHGKHMFYPIMGKEKTDVIFYNQPLQFKGRSMPYKLFMSTFSRVDNIMSKHNLDDITLKFPFTIDKKEIEIIGTHDTRQAAFGIFWSGILLISLILLFFVKNKKEPNKKICYLILGTLALSILLNPENWWGRYVPQFYAIPIFIALFYLLTNYSKTRKIITYLYLFLIFINSSWIFCNMYYKNLSSTEHLNTQKRNMRLIKRDPFMIENLENTDVNEGFTAVILQFLDEYRRK